MACNCQSKDDMIAKLVQVWKNTDWPSAEEKKESNRRAEICLTSGKNKQPCVHNKNLMCKQTGIWIPALVRQMSSRCPINKWSK